MIKKQVRFWSSVVGAVALTLLVVFGFWAWVEVVTTAQGTFLHTIHALRGITSGMASAGIAAALIVRHQRKREAERSSIERERDLLHKLFEDDLNSVRAGVLLLDDQGTVVKANRTAETIHGRALVGEPFPNVACARASACNDCPITDSLHTGQSAVRNKACVGPTAEVFVPSVRPVQLPEGGRGFLVVEQVTTEQVRLRSQLVHQEKMATFGLLSAGIAHDLGNPINAIDMHLQLLQMEDGLSPQVQESLDTIREEILRMQRVLRELVDLARRRRDDAAAVDLSRLVKDAITLIRHDRRMRGVEVSLDLSPDTPSVEAIEDHLMQVLLNLIINALDAMPLGGRLRIETFPSPDTDDTDDNTGPSATLRLSDNGEGMSQEVLNRCLEPLFTTKPPGKGTGLGLSIVRDIITNTGGHLAIQSALGRGTTISITLPTSLQSSPLPPSCFPDDPVARLLRQADASPAA